MFYSGDRAMHLRASGYLARLVCLSLILLSLASAATIRAATADDDVKKLVRQAVKLARAESLDEAESLLRKALEIDSNSADAKVELGFVLMKQRRLLDAYNIVFPVVQADPQNSRAYAVFGTILLTAGRFDDARAVFYTAIKTNSTEDLAWAGYGLLDYYENNINLALNNMRRAVEYGPREPDYQFALAQITSRAEKYTEAADAFRRFLEISSNKDRDRRERIVGLIKFLTYLGHRQDLYELGGKDQTVVKFDLVGNRPIITLRVNDRDEPLQFVLDTGSSITVISDVTAERLGIKRITRGGYAKGIGGDGKFEIVYGFLRQLQIGDVKVRSVPVYIRKFHRSQQQVDGYIGLALISKFLTTIDYGDRTFSLTAKDDDRRQFDDQSEMTLPLRLTSSGFLSGEVQLEGVESKLNFIVDTGATISVISNRVATMEGISPFAGDETLQVIGSAGVTENVPTYLLPKVTFGPHTRTFVSAVALDLNLINESSGFEQAGILGGNFLRNYRLTFDFRNSKVMFTSINPENSSSR